jgi:hypothetical protein
MLLLRALIIVFTLVPHSAFSTSCRPETLQVLWEKSAYIFVGTVVEGDEKIVMSEGYRTKESAVIKFQVRQVIKGQVGEEFDFQRGARKFTGIPQVKNYFYSGSEHLVYADKEKRPLGCAPSKPMPEGRQDIVGLRHAKRSSELFQTLETILTSETDKKRLAVIKKTGNHRKIDEVMMKTYWQQTSQDVRLAVINKVANRKDTSIATGDFLLEILERESSSDLKQVAADHLRNIDVHYIPYFLPKVEALKRLRDPVGGTIKETLVILKKRKKKWETTRAKKAKRAIGTDSSDSTASFEELKKEMSK